MCTVCTKTYTSISDVVAESMAGGTTVYICRTCCHGDDDGGGGGGSGGAEQPLNMCVKTRKRTRSDGDEAAGGGRGEDGAKKENHSKLRRNGEENKKYRCVGVAMRVHTSVRVSG